MEPLDDSRFSYVSRQRYSPYKYDTVINAFMRNAKKYPDKEIFIQHDVDGSRESITYTEMKKEALQLARYLISKGIKKGDHVALFGPNTIAWVVGELAIIIAGGIVVHIAISITDTTDIWEIFAKTDSKAFLIDPGKGDRFHESIFQLLALFRRRRPSRQYRDVDASNPTVLFLRDMEGMQSYPSLRKVMDMASLPDDFPTLYPEDDIVVFSTSGSTGKPKMVAHSHFDALNLEMHPPMKEEDIVKSVAYNDRPFGWAGGSPFLNLCRGETRVFTDASIAIMGKDTKRVWGIIKSERCTSALLMPYFLGDLIQMKDTYKETFKLKAILSGGQMIDNYYTQVIGVFTDTLIVGYGSTEAWFVAIREPLKQGDTLEIGHNGEVIPGLELKVIDANGSVTEMGKPGELCVRSGLLFRGYYLNDEATKNSFLSGNWFKTGDTGYLKDDKTVVIQGRIKEVISRGTRKIMPDAVEDIIIQMDSILHVVVVAVPDRRLYEEVCACFVVKEGHDVSEKDVEEHCNSKMLRRETLDGLGDIPTYYLKFDSFPCLLTGKPHKRNVKLAAIRRLGLS